MSAWAKGREHGIFQHAHARELAGRDVKACDQIFRRDVADYVAIGIDIDESIGFSDLVSLATLSATLENEFQREGARGRIHSVAPSICPIDRDSWINQIT